MKLRLTDIEFLLSAAPVFDSYLLVFQWEGSLVHIIHEQITELLVTLMRRLIKESVINNCVKTKDLLAIDVSNINNQIPLQSIDFGVKPKLLSKPSEKKKQKVMRHYAIRMLMWQNTCRKSFH